jgi:hypothetical protein
VPCRLLQATLRRAGTRWLCVMGPDLYPVCGRNGAGVTPVDSKHFGPAIIGNLGPCGERPSLSEPASGLTPAAWPLRSAVGRDRHTPRRITTFSSTVAHSAVRKVDAAEAVILAERTYSDCALFLQRVCTWSERVATALSQIRGESSESHLQRVASENPADVLVGQPAARANDNDNDKPSRRSTSTGHVGVTAAPSELRATPCNS